MFKENDIIVRTGGTQAYGSFGVMYIVKEARKHDVIVLVNGHGEICPSNFNIRLATQLEINAYNKGIRNINDIKKQLIIEIY